MSELETKDARTLLHKTTALCPDCLTELPAEVYADGDGVVWMERTCSDHGRLATRMWPDAEHYQWLRSLAFPPTAPENTIPATAPCPHGCGTCSRHVRRGTLLEIEVTRNCNPHCPVCFMSAETGEGEDVYKRQRRHCSPTTCSRPLALLSVRPS